MTSPNLDNPSTCHKPLRMCSMSNPINQQSIRSVVLHNNSTIVQCGDTSTPSQSIINTPITYMLPRPTQSSNTNPTTKFMMDDYIEASVERPHNNNSIPHPSNTTHSAPASDKHVTSLHDTVEYNPSDSCTVDIGNSVSCKPVEPEPVVRTVYELKNHDILRETYRTETGMMAYSKTGSKGNQKMTDHWMFDSGASLAMSPDSSMFTKYRKCTEPDVVSAADDTQLRIRGYGDLSVIFDGTNEILTLHDVAHVPELEYNLISLGNLDQEGRWFTIGEGILVMHDSNLVLPRKNGVHTGRATRTNPKKRNQTKIGVAKSAVVRPGDQNPTIVDINRFHRAYFHMNENLLRKTAEQLGIVLTGTLAPCSGCLAAKGYKRPVHKFTKTRATQRLTRVFVDLCGPKRTRARDGSYYTMIVKDDFSRRNWLYFLKHKNEAHIAFRKILRDVKGDGIVEYVRSDNGREFQGAFSDLCLEREIKNEYTSPNCPQQNAVAERALAMIDSAQQTVRYHARELFSHDFVDLPKETNSLWAHASAYVADCMNRTATSANVDSVTPDEMYYGETPKIKLMPFLQPGYVHRKRDHKLQPKATLCFYLGPAPNHSSDTYTVLVSDTNQIIMSRDVVWLADQNFASDPLSAKSHKKTQNYDRNRDDGQGIDRDCMNHGNHDSDTESDALTDNETISSGSNGDSDEYDGSSDSSNSDHSDDDCERTGSDCSYDSDRDSDSDDNGSADDGHDDDEVELGRREAARRHTRSTSGGARQNGRPPPELRGGGTRSTSAGTGGMIPGTEATGEGTRRNEAREIGASGEDASNSEDSEDEDSSGDDDSPGPVSRLSRSKSRRTRSDVDITGGGDPRDYIRNLTELGSRPSGDDGTCGSRLVNEDTTPSGDAEEQETDDPPSISHGERERAVSFEMPLADAQHNAANDSRPSGRGSRTRRQLETHIPDAPGQEPVPSTRSSGRISENTRSKTRIGLAGRATPKAIGKLLSEVEPEPQSYEEAGRSIYRELWQQAMDAEFRGLSKSGTFGAPVEMQDRKPVGSKWVFRWKVDAHGKIAKPKARLVARGFSQKEGVDFWEIFSPTPQASSIRLLLAIAVQSNLDIVHFDAEQAFIQSTLKEDIFMRLPPGCGNMSGKIVKLHRSLYGLKQAGRCWNHLLVRRLTEFGFDQSEADQCIFRIRKGGKVTMMLAVHVDDMVIAGSKDDYEKLLKFLNKSFPVKNLGALTHYMGCSFVRDRRNGILSMSQESYVDKLVERFGVTKTNHVPVCPTVELDARRESEEKAKVPYREAVGGLLWIAGMTRPDISHAVRSVAAHSHDPCARHWGALMQILAYLKGTRDMGLTFSRNSDRAPTAFADASYASDRDSRKSVSGGLVMYGGAAVAWFSRRQRCVATSSAESEYVALSECAKELMSVKLVWDFLRPKCQTSPVKIFEDNRAAMHLANNSQSAKRTRHIDVAYHYVPDLVDNGTIEVLHVASCDQRADVLTKSLGRASFEGHRNFLLNQDGDVYAGKGKKSFSMRRRCKGGCSMRYPDDYFTSLPDGR